MSNEKTAAELRAELDESEALRERLAELLTGVAAALKGEPGPLAIHDWSDLPELAAAMRERLCGPVGDDPMPMFVIKAKDRLAVAAVSAYRRLCEADGLTDQAAQVRLAAAEISAWRERNPGAVKTPDHAHVPVA